MAAGRVDDSRHDRESPDSRLTPGSGNEPFRVRSPRHSRGVTMRAPTMKDIAAASGVSQSTVSRVLSGTRTAVPINEVTRQRVLDVARQMRYYPNPLARGLRGSRTMLLGVIVREITDPFFATAVDAVSSEARKLGYNVVLGHTHGRTEEARAVRAVLETRHCDAIVVLGDTSDQPKFIDDLRQANVDVVGMWQGSGRVRGVQTVSVDNAAGVNMLIDHLYGLGHRRFGFISGGFQGGRLIGDIAERRSAFVERLASERLFIQSSWMREAANTMAGGAAAFEALMREVDRPTAVICSTDVLAIGALHAARRAGLAVPDEISIVGFDDLPLAPYTNPALTTVHNPTGEMAEVGVQAAVEATNQSKDGWVRVLAPSLIVRDSSGRPRDARV